MIKKLKYFLWKAKIIKKNICPYDKNKLTEHGHFGSNLRWSCPDDNCEFNKNV